MVQCFCHQHKQTAKQTYRDHAIRCLWIMTSEILRSQRDIVSGCIMTDIID